MLTGLIAMAVTPTIVLIHGAGGGAWEWNAWTPTFQRAGWKVIARDLQPASGGLEKTRLEDYVRQVESWCPKKGPVVLVGASMGGMLALLAAKRVRPAAIVLVNSVTPAGTGRTQAPPVIRWAGGPIEETRSAMPDSDEKTIQFAWRHWRDDSGAVMNALGRPIAVGRLQCPVLVVIGEEDTTIPPAKQQAMARRFSATVHRYPGMSHVGPLLGTKAPRVADRTLGWLQSKIAK